MLRALLALIFAILVSPATVSGAGCFAVAKEAKPAVASFDPSPRHQGRDTLDVEHQPCFNLRSGGGKPAAELPIAAQLAIGTLVGEVSKPTDRTRRRQAVFLHACAPRAPPRTFAV
jgi:hypothetical protein